MNPYSYTRPTGEHATYTIEVQANEYVISRDGDMRKREAFSAPLSCPLAVIEQRSLSLAIDDINRLRGMDE